MQALAIDQSDERVSRAARAGHGGGEAGDSDRSAGDAPHRRCRLRRENDDDRETKRMSLQKFQDLICALSILSTPQRQWIIWITGAQVSSPGIT